MSSKDTINSTHTEEGDSEKKRKRISQACDFCRSRHLKCDGEETCFQCESRDVVCVYSPKKRRGPKPKEAKFSVKKRKTEPDSNGDMYPVFFHTIMKDYCCSKGKTWIDHPSDGALEFYQFLKGDKLQAQMDYLVNAFGYGVIFAYGAQIFGESEVAWDFAGKALKLLMKLIFKCSIFSDEVCRDPKFLELMILLAEFYSHYLDFTKSKAIMAQALTLVQLKEFPADLSARVYSFMMVCSTNTIEKLKWFEIVNSLTPNLSIFGRINIILSLPTELDKTQHYIYAHRNTPTKNRDIKYVLEVIQFIDSTEDILSHLLSIGRMEDEEILNYCKLAIYGTRSIIYTKLGLLEIALSWSNEAMTAAKLLRTTNEQNFRVRTAVVYTVIAALLSGNSELYESYDFNSVKWPIFARLHDAIHQLAILTKEQINIETGNELMTHGMVDLPVFDTLHSAQ